MKRLLGALLALSIASCGGGGGGSSSTTYTFNGKFVSSYVKGLRVCTEDENYCTTTDSYGNFSVKSSSASPTVVFYVDRVKLGKYTIKENWETVTPFKLSSNPQTGDIVARVIHAIGEDIEGTEEVIDLSNLSVKAEPEVNSILSAVESGKSFTLTVNSNGKTYRVKVSPDQSSVELCRDDQCQPVKYRQWLVLVFMDGDNSLSEYVEEDLDEISQVTYNPQVKVVVLADSLNQDGTVIAESNGESGQLEISRYPEETNMGSGCTLKKFIREYEDKYPASKVALIFWDHGDGWRSSKFAAVDETNNSYLFMYKLVDALKELYQNGYRVDLIGFDECLMGMAEVFYDVGQFTDVVVASETLEPGAGWDYSVLLGSLVENPSLDPYQLGKVIVDAYRETYRGQEGVTLVALRREEVDELTRAINSLYTRLNRETYPEFRQARENSVTVPDNQDGTLYHIDLYSFASQLKDRYPEASKIVSLIENAYSFSTNPQLRGISIYFPPDRDSDQSFPCYLLESPSIGVNCFSDPDYYNPFAVNLWDDFLDEYYRLGE